VNEYDMVTQGRLFEMLTPYTLPPRDPNEPPILRAYVRYGGSDFFYTPVLGAIMLDKMHYKESGPYGFPQPFTDDIRALFLFLKQYSTFRNLGVVPSLWTSLDAPTSIVNFVSVNAAQFANAPPIRVFTRAFPLGNSRSILFYQLDVVSNENTRLEPRF